MVRRFAVKEEDEARGGARCLTRRRAARGRQQLVLARKEKTWRRGQIGQVEQNCVGFSVADLGRVQRNVGLKMKKKRIGIWIVKFGFLI
jgi:hypothetical protein